MYLCIYLAIKLLVTLVIMLTSLHFFITSSSKTQQFSSNKLIIFYTGLGSSSISTSYHLIQQLHIWLGEHFSLLIFYTLPEIFLSISIIFWFSFLFSTANTISIGAYTTLHKWKFFLVMFLLSVALTGYFLQFLSPNLPLLINSYFSLSKGVLELKLLLLCLNYFYFLNFSTYELTPIKLNIFGFTLSFYLLATLLLLEANNLFLIFFCLEIQNFLTYILIAFYKTRQTTISSIFLYLLFNSILTIFFLFSLLIIYGFLKTLLLSELKIIFTILITPSTLLNWLLYSILLLLSIILIKLASAPFHFWVKDIYAGLPLSITGFLLLNTKFILFFLLLKILLTFSNSVTEFFFLQTLQLCGIFSIIVGTFVTLYQKTLKTFLICSSIPHTGYLLLGLLQYSNTVTLIPALNYLFQYLFLVIIIWSIALTFLESTNQLDISFTELHLYFKYFPGLSLLLSFSLLSLAGLPPFLGFFFKYQLFLSIASFQFSLIFLVLISSLISCFYYLQFIKFLLFDSTQKFTFNLAYNFFKQINQITFLLVIFCSFVISSFCYQIFFNLSTTLIYLCYLI